MLSPSPDKLALSRWPTSAAATGTGHQTFGSMTSGVFVFVGPKAMPARSRSWTIT